MYNHGRPVARLVALQGSLANGNEPLYRHPVDIHPLFRPWTPFVGTLREKIEELTNEKFNHVLIQYYRTFSDQIQSHTDKTLDIVEGSSIVNLSFGATREMTLKGKDFGRNGKRPHFYVNLVHDSLFILDSVTNRFQSSFLFCFVLFCFFLFFLFYFFHKILKKIKNKKDISTCSQIQSNY